MVVEHVVFTKKFEKQVKILDSSVKEKVKKQIKKILENPLIGKPLKYNLRGERTVYVKPFRIIYSFNKDVVYFLRCMHRKDVY